MDELVPRTKLSWDNFKVEAEVKSKKKVQPMQELCTAACLTREVKLSLFIENAFSLDPASPPFSKEDFLRHFSVQSGIHISNLVQHRIHQHRNVFPHFIGYRASEGHNRDDKQTRIPRTHRLNPTFYPNIDPAKQHPERVVS